jgi:hypothetical protein
MNQLSHTSNQSSRDKYCICVDKTGHRCIRITVEDVMLYQDVSPRYYAAAMQYCAECFHGLCDVDDEALRHTGAQRT